jgi:hypothetical protein
MVIPESVEWFTEEQAFLRSYDSAPHPPSSLPPLSGEQFVSLSQSSCVSPVELTYGREKRGGEEPTKSHDREEAWSSIIMQYSPGYRNAVSEIPVPIRESPQRTRSKSTSVRWPYCLGMNTHKKPWKSWKYETHGAVSTLPLRGR